MQENTILGIDPGTKEMGIAIIRGATLISFGVHTLRNGHRPHDLIGQARRILLATIEEYGPQVVAIEKPYVLPTKRAAILSVIEQELRGRADDLGLRVVELTPEAIRQAVVGNPRATKIDVAQALVAGDFGQLADLVPKRPARAALGLRARDKYWLHMFDALALAIAAARMVTGATL
jgi:Holliday junction resolvasome RuvABC endonuclease subunit